jgi:hypothetical protein
VFRRQNVLKLKCQPGWLLFMILVRRATPLKKTAFSLAVSVFAAFIVLPVIHSVNHLAGEHVIIDRTVRADGDPLPPPLPPIPKPPGFVA